MPNVTAHRHVRCVGELPRLLLAVTARTVLWSVLLLALWASLPAAFGWHVTTVVSDSMAPGVRTGDVVAAVPVGPDEVETGRVLLVEDPDHQDRLRLHRLERIEQDGALRLRGDANPTVDRTAVSPDAVLGVGVLRFPWTGLPAVWVRERSWTSLLLAAAATALFVVAARADRGVVRGQPCRRCGSPRWDTTSPALVPGSPRGASEGGTSWALPAVAAVLAVTTALTVTAGAGFSDTTDSTSSLRTQTFPCFAHRLDDPRLAWDFDEKSGPRVLDRSGHGADGLARLDPSRNDASCAGNPSMHFATTDSRISTTTAVPAPQVFSVEAWFRTDHAGGRILGFSSSLDAASPFKDRHLWVTADGRLGYGVQGSNDFRFMTGSAARVDDGRWHHAVGTFRSGRLEVWLDGTLVGTRTDIRSAKQYDGYWRIGRESLDPWPGQPSDYTFRGDVDTVRVYDRVLSPSTIADHAAAGR